MYPFICSMIRNLKGGLASAWGDFFEVFAIMALSSGGTFTIRHLTSAAPSEDASSLAAEGQISKAQRIHEEHHSPSSPAWVAPDEQQGQAIGVADEEDDVADEEDHDEEYATVGNQDRSSEHHGQPTEEEQLSIEVPADLELIKDCNQDLDPNKRFMLLAALVNQPGWDAVLVLDGVVYILQMTVGAKHHVQMQAIVKLLRRFKPSPAKSHMCFVLPEERFYTYQQQHYWNSKKGQRAVRLHAELSDVSQLAVLIGEREIRRRSADSLPVLTSNVRE